MASETTRPPIDAEGSDESSAGAGLEEDEDGEHREEPEQSHRIRVMLDTTVLVAGSGWPRWPYEVLTAGLRGQIQIVLCPYILVQARRIIVRRFPEHLSRFEVFIAHAPIEVVPDPTSDEVAAHADLLRDATDVPIALAAIDAGVDYLVSEDKDLTVQDATTEHLRAKLTVRLPGTFLRQVLGWSSDELEQVRGRRWEDMDPEETL
jgi:predicted nucleic acid-binding protein